MMSKPEQVLKVSVVALTVSALFSSGAWAQEKIEEVVVTAQKREQKVQDVPIAITAITAKAIEDRDVESVGDLNGLAPNLRTSTAPTTSLTITANMRGIGQGQPAIWGDPAVGIYVDGAFVGKNTGAMIDVIDLERIEVLRGPQGTLFGRNTQAGAINFISRKPLGTLALNANIEVGNYGMQSTRVGLELPKVNGLSVGMAVKREKRDGLVDDSNNPASDGFGSKDRTSARLSAKLELSKDAVINYMFDNTDIDETPRPMTLSSLGNGGSTNYGLNFFSRLPSNGATLVSSEYKTSIPAAKGYDYIQAVKVKGHRVLGDFNLAPNMTLKYIGSYRDMDFKDFSDYGAGYAANLGAIIPMYVGGQDTQYDNQSHEIQLVGSTDQMRYVLGYYRFKEDGAVLTKNFGIIAGNGQSRSRAAYEISTDASGMFGQVDFDVTKELTVTAGLRSTTEDKYGSGRTLAGGAATPWEQITFVVPGSSGTGQAEFKKNTPVFALGYKLDAETNLYARYAVGYRSGGFNVQSSSPADRYEPETSKSIEAGFKRTFANGKGILNVAVFNTTVEDAQQSVLPPGGITPKFLNAAEATIRGLEVDGTVRLSGDWLANFGYGFTNGKFDSFDNAGVDIGSITAYPGTPKHNFNVNLTGTIAKTSLGRLRAVADVTYQAKSYAIVATPGKAAGQPGGTSLWATEVSELKSLLMVNGKLMLSDIQAGQGRAEAYLWVKNALDKRQENYRLNLGFVVSSWTEPRTLGLGVTYKFD
ncbi:MAG: TonB-dependent receptor [Betaproteobacteria bacterium]|nr:TonB-dependent receptor [Betaproteobacteria bacterium]